MAQCTQSIGHARWIWIRRSLPREELLCTVRSVFLHSERQFQSLPERFGDADGRASNDPWKASCQQKIFLGQSSICILGSARIDMFSCVHPQSAILQFWTICQMWAWEAVRKYLNFQFLRLGWDFRCLIFWLENMWPLVLVWRCLESEVCSFYMCQNSVRFKFFIQPRLYPDDGFWPHDLCM